MDQLADLDQVAYVRFASVYRNFREAKDFEAFIGTLSEEADEQLRTTEQTYRLYEACIIPRKTWAWERMA